MMWTTRAAASAAAVQIPEGLQDTAVYRAPTLTAACEKRFWKVLAQYLTRNDRMDAAMRNVVSRALRRGGV